MFIPYLTPEWFQAIFAGILVVITICYAISTNNMAKSTQEMAKTSAKQIEFLEKERLRHVIIDLANIYRKIGYELEKAKKTLKSGYIFHPNYPDSELLTPLIPILDSQIHMPDAILENYDDKIKNYTLKYDKYLIEGQKIINRFIEQKPAIWDEFTVLCDKLGKEDSDYILNNKTYWPDIFLISLTSPDLVTNHMLYGYFKKNKDELTTFFNENGFSEAIVDYNEFRKELFLLIDEYAVLLDDLIRDWKREYSIIDSDLKDFPFYSY